MHQAQAELWQKRKISVFSKGIVPHRDKINSINQQQTDTPTQVIAIAVFVGTPLAGKTAETTGKDSRKGPERQEMGLSGFVLESFPVKIWTRAKIERCESCKKSHTQSDLDGNSIEWPDKPVRVNSAGSSLLTFFHHTDAGRSTERADLACTPGDVVRGCSSSLICSSP